MPKASSHVRSDWRGTIVATKSFVQRIVGWIVVALALLPGPPAANAKSEKPLFGDVEIFASVPAVPGFPEGISVDGNLVYVSGPAGPGTAGNGRPSKILVYKRSNGQLKTEIVVSGENLDLEHTLTNSAHDRDGRLYVLSNQPFAPADAQLGLLRFTRHGQTYTQETYAGPFPNQPTCAFGPIPVICALLNDLAFADDGSAYVTDSFQATIWRVPPGGGTPVVWLQSPLLAGSLDSPFGPFGVNGIRLDPSRQCVYVSVTYQDLDPDPDKGAQGAIYRVPLGNPAGIELFHAYHPGEAPDGIAFGASGRLYVALLGTDQISVLAPDGSELVRISSAVSDPIPLDEPASIAFHNGRKSLLVTNHSVFDPDPDHFAVLEVFVGDTADPLVTPDLP
jgi:hypothetical protein